MKITILISKSHTELLRETKIHFQARISLRTTDPRIHDFAQQLGFTLGHPRNPGPAGTKPGILGEGVAVSPLAEKENGSEKENGKKIGRESLFLRSFSAFAGCPTGFIVDSSPRVRERNEFAEQSMPHKYFT